MPPKRAKAPKKEQAPLEPEVIEKFDQIGDELEERESILMIKFAQLKAELLVALKQDIEQFSDSNPDTVNMLLVDYLKGKENEEQEEVSAPSSDEEKNTENTGKTPLGIPKFIKTKKIGFRVPKANEMLFSANGTPITYPETQKILTLTTQCYSEVREVLTCASSITTPAPIPMEDFNEVD